LFYEQEALIGLADKQNVIARTKKGLRFAFSNILVASTQLNSDWTRQPPVGKKKTDRTFLLTMGYQW